MPGRPPHRVLVHGFTQTGASWAPVLARLGPAAAVRCPDLPGHGARHAERAITWERAVEALAADVPPGATLAGYSMGGRLALAVAARDPARLGRLVLIGASPGLADPGERAARRAADEALAGELERTSIETFADRWAAQPLFATQPPEVAAAARADRLHNDPEALAAALRALGTGTMPPLWEALPRLDLPVALVAGAHDARFRRLAEAMAARLPRAELHAVPGAGHAAHLEAPAVVAALL